MDKKKVSKEEWEDFRRTVYEYLFYSEMKWDANSPSVYFNGTLIHYSDFMKAKRGSL